MNKDALELAVKMAGGPSKLARAANVSRQQVWNWRNRDMMLPAEAVLPIERATGVSRHKLRPDLYPIEDIVA